MGSEFKVYKDRRHYGLLLREEVVEVTPEMARRWLRVELPRPVMWTRGFSHDEKTDRYAADMASGDWEVERDVEPIMVNQDKGYVLGGRHRLTAVILVGRPQPLRIRFYHKPHGWDQTLQEQKQREGEAAIPDRPTCSTCGSHLHTEHAA